MMNLNESLRFLDKKKDSALLKILQRLNLFALQCNEE